MMISIFPAFFGNTWGWIQSSAQAYWTHITLLVKDFLYNPLQNPTGIICVCAVPIGAVAGLAYLAKRQYDKSIAQKPVTGGAPSAQGSASPQDPSHIPTST